jgi:hypothetical protein
VRPFPLVLSLLLSVTHAFAATIAIGPEHSVAPLSVALTTPYANYGAPLIASDGQSFLVAWTATYSSGLGAIVTASLDSGGAVQHTAVLPYQLDADIVALAWTGETYRIVWQERSDLTIAAADVDRDGAVVHSRAVIVPPHIAARMLAVACSRDRTLALYQKQTPGPYERAATIVDVHGGVIRGEFQATDVMPRIQSATVVADDDGFSFFWSDVVPAQFRTTLFARHLTLDGIAETEPVALAEVGVVYPLAAAFNAGRFAVSFFENVVTPGTSLVASASVRRFVIDRSWTAVELPATAIPVRQPVQAIHVVSDGSGFLAYWRAGNNTNGLETVRFSDQDPGIVEEHLVQMLPATDASLAAGGEVVGVDGSGAGFVLDGTPQGVQVGTFPIARYPVAQMPHGVASLGSQSLVVWSEIDLSDPNGLTRALFAMRVGGDGAAIDSAPLFVARASSTDGLNPPGVAVVAGGSRYWVSWTTGAINLKPTVMLRSISPDGSMGDVVTTPFHGQRVSLASDGNELLLAFAGDTTSLAVARFTATGALLDSAPVVLGRSYATPRMAWNGENYLVAWTEPELCTERFCTVPYFNSHIAAARVSRSGADLDPTPIAVTSLRPYNDRLLVAGVASDGRDTLIAYNQNGDAMAKRVLREGVLGDSVTGQDGNLIERSARVTALQAGPNGYVAFTSPVGLDAPSFESEVIRCDSRGAAIESEGTFMGTVAGAAMRGDGMWQVAISRPAGAREAAGATQAFTRMLSLVPPRVRAVRQH